MNLNVSLFENNIMIDIRIGDCLDEMKLLDDKSIDCIITSPPYWSQRDYDSEKQWGNEKTIEEYIYKILLWDITVEFKFIII